MTSWICGGPRAARTINDGVQPLPACLIVGGRLDDVLRCAIRLHHMSRQGAPFGAIDVTAPGPRGLGADMADVFFQADTGTVVLIHAHRIPTAQQAVVMRLIEEGWYRGAGGIWRRADVQVVGTVPAPPRGAPSLAGMREDLARTLHHLVIRLDDSDA